MNETIVISTEEYKRLLEESIKFQMAKSYVEKANYITGSEVKLILGAEKRLDA